jgi:hypothetical protein
MSKDSSDIDKKTSANDDPQTADSADRAGDDQASNAAESEGTRSTADTSSDVGTTSAEGTNSVDGTSSIDNEGTTTAPKDEERTAKEQEMAGAEETPVERNVHQIRLAAEQIHETEAKPASDVGEVDPETQKTAEEVAQLLAESLKQLMDDKDAPPAPTESYIHPVTGREVYVPKNSRTLGPSAVIMTFSLLMFVGGALATLMMVARAFELHGTALLTFVIGSCAVVLGMAGGLLLRTFGDNDKWWVGAGVGACFGAMSAVLIYLQTSHHAWWR